jgi:hypothetical protein
MNSSEKIRNVSYSLRYTQDSFWRKFHADQPFLKPVKKWQSSVSEKQPSGLKGVINVLKK